MNDSISLACNFFYFFLSSYLPFFFKIKRKKLSKLTGPQVRIIY